MKLSKLVYHNGAVKVEVYAKGQARKRWNTGVRVDSKLLNRERFIIENKSIDWRALNVQIAEQKEVVDKIVREVFKKNGYVDVLEVFNILETHHENEKLAFQSKLQKRAFTGTLYKKKMKSIINELDEKLQQKLPRIKYHSKHKPQSQTYEERQSQRDALKKEEFIQSLESYISSEERITSLNSVGKAFVQYLREGTDITLNNLVRHKHIFMFMVNRPIEISSMSESWVRDLIAWLKNGCDGESINSNTTYWFFLRFQCFWTWAVNNNYSTQRMNWKKFDIPTFKVMYVWLKEDRIKQLADVRFDDDTLESARKAFLFLCLTGMRHSDFHSLNPSEVVVEDNEKWIYKVNKKTKTELKVELPKSMEDWILNPEILSKMKMSQNRNNSNSRLNKAIREIGKKLGWDEEVRMRKNHDTWVTKPFYEWLRCHCSRHTAVWHWLNNGFTDWEIELATGWKGPKMIKYYAEISKLKPKKRMSQILNIN